MKKISVMFVDLHIWLAHLFNLPILKKCNACRNKTWYLNSKSSFVYEYHLTKSYCHCFTKFLDCTYPLICTWTLIEFHCHLRVHLIVYVHKTNRPCKRRRSPAILFSIIIRMPIQMHSIMRYQCSAPRLRITTLSILGCRQRALTTIFWKLPAAEAALQLQTVTALSWKSSAICCLLTAKDHRLV